MTKWAWILVLLTMTINATKAVANTIFDEDRGWAIHSLEKSDETYACAASKQIENVEVVVTPIRRDRESYTLLTLTVRNDQVMKSANLEILIDQQQLLIARKQTEINQEKINILIPSAELDLNRVGTIKSLQINLTPHTRVDLDTPKYAMYLLQECSRTVNEALHQQELIPLIVRRFPRFINTSQSPNSSQDSNQQTQVKGQNTTDTDTKTSLPASFREFVKAFTMIAPEKLKFLPVEEAKTKYKRDWIESGWTGASELVFGLGYATDLSPDNVIDYWTKDRRTNCEQSSGIFQTKDLGIRRDGDFLAHVGFTLCERNDGWLALSKTSYDMQSKAFGITEVVAYDESHKQSLNNWFDELN